ncbi:hypothetical protein F5Y16DRAFT_399471 [Xylariaceae sp. FL0255]|nr:hypothetical protein F5Y16DRAFT_399471 [Xylariaceae sp. FL0255]
MVGLFAIRTANAALVEANLLVSVFVGGTSGIGDFSLRELVKTDAAHGGANELRIYLVGRKVEATDKIIPECLSISATTQVMFVQAQDISIMKDVDRVGAEIISLEDKQVHRADIHPESTCWR